VHTITSKYEIREIGRALLDVLETEGFEAFIAQLHRSVLKRKVKFPMLEELSYMLYEALPDKMHIHLCDAIMNLNEMGSSVMAGKILQFRSPGHLKKSIAKAVEYISANEEWYVCDHIAERVQGYALLTQPDKSLPMLKQLLKHENAMVVRSVGVATHYAVKKGLSEQHAEVMFELLLQYANVTQYHAKTGIGWGAKTVVKFYPQIAERHQAALNDEDKVKQWFRTKVSIGLSRKEKYAR
jgi:hypothetical protein